MKDFEKIVESLDICANNPDCSKCAYENAGNKISCHDVLKQDALALIKELKAQLEQPTTACDSEIIAQNHSEEIRKLHDKLADAEITLERTQRELAEAEQELKYLRAVKATTEAFLGVKIDGYIN
jgi:chromosome segregation ATPase